MLVERDILSELLFARATQSSSSGQFGSHPGPVAGVIPACREWEMISHSRFWGRRTVRFWERSAVSRRSGAASLGKYAPSARDANVAVLGASVAARNLPFVWLTLDLESFGCALTIQPKRSPF